MSVTNILVGADEACLYTDTMVYRNGKPLRLNDRKCHVSRCGTFAVAGRGNAWWIDRYEEILDLSPDFDHAAQGLCSLLEGTVAALDDGWFDRGNLVALALVGWSASAGALRAVMVKAGRDGVTAEPIPHGVHLWPGSTRLQLPATATDAQMVKAAMVQHRIQQSFGLPICIGGVLHRTVVTRDGISQEIAAVYPDYDDHAAQLGDPNAEAVADWRAAAGKVAA